MYKDLSLKEKAKVLLYGSRLGLTSVEDIAKLYDDAISHKFAEGSMSTPDWDPDNPYHYHTTSGEKVVITPEDWEKHKGLPYFKQVEDAVLAEQAAHPGPEYIINPKFSEDLRRVYKGNMGPLYQNYSSFSSNLPQGYGFTPEGLVQDNQGNLYVLKGFRQTPRFTYDESSPLTFPVLEGRNQGNVTFYPVNMEKTIKPSLPISSVMNVDKEHESAIRKAQNQYEYPVTLWDILPTGEGVISTYDNVYSTTPYYGDDYSKNYHPYKDKGAKQFFENYISNIIGREIKLNGPSYMWDDNGNFRNVYADDVFNLSPKEFNLVKKKLKEAKNRDYEFEKKKTEENLNKFKQEGILMGDDEDVYRNSIKYYEDWINQDNPWLWGADEDRSPKPRKISRKEAEKRAVIEVGPLQVNNVLTYAKGGPIVTPYGQWKYPGKDTIIPSNNITMDNVNYPVLGISDAGDAKVMMPWHDYKFKGSIVYEHPLQEGGNIKPTFDLWYPTVPKQKNDTSSYDLRRAYNTLPFEEMEKFRTINDYHLPSVAYDEKTDTYTFLKRNGHPTLNYELDWYNSGSPDALEFRERYKLDTLSLPWRYIPNYAKGGSIHIDPKNKGKLTETMKRTGKSKYELAHSKNPLTRKRALFAINASHWKHDEGGHLFLEDGWMNTNLLTLFDKYSPNSHVIQIDKPIRLNEVLIVADAPKSGDFNYDKYIANTYDAWKRGDVDINTLPTETRNRVRGYSGTIATLKGMNTAAKVAGITAAIPAGIIGGINGAIYGAPYLMKGMDYLSNPLTTITKGLKLGSTPLTIALVGDKLIDIFGTEADIIYGINNLKYGKTREGLTEIGLSALPIVSNARQFVKARKMILQIPHNIFDDAINKATKVYDEDYLNAYKIPLRRSFLTTPYNKNPRVMFGGFERMPTAGGFANQNEGFFKIELPNMLSSFLYAGTNNGLKALNNFVKKHSTPTVYHEVRHLYQPYNTRYFDIDVPLALRIPSRGKYYTANTLHPLYKSSLHIFDKNINRGIVNSGWRSSPAEFDAEMGLFRLKNNLGDTRFYDWDINDQNKAIKKLSKSFHFSKEDTKKILFDMSKFGYFDKGGYLYNE